MKKKVWTAALTLGLLLGAAACPANVMAASAKARIPVTTEGQEVDYFHGVPALYIPGTNNANSGTYSCAGYVKSFYGKIYGIVPTNLFTSATPNAPKGTFSQVDTPRPGDIGNRTSHWFIIKEVNGDGTCTVIEQNWKWADGDTVYCYINRKVDYANDKKVRFFRWSDSWALPEEDPLDTAKMVSAGEHTYAMINDVLSWEDAKAKCAAMGGHLATVTSENEQNIVNYLTRQGMRTGYWIGATDEAAEGTFRWVTGETFSYSNWYTENFRSGSSRDYVYIGSDNRWYDSEVTDLSTAVGYLCEWDQPNYHGARQILNITSQPADVVAASGTMVKFTVAASGDGVGYQWQISDDAGKTWRNSAVKSATYATTLTNDNNGRQMRCIVTDQYGSKVTSRAAGMKLSELKITAQPKTAVVLNGATAQFTVAASGDGLAYQWEISDDAGQTWRASAVKTATYTTTLTSKINGRRLRCVVSDKYGAKVTSNAVALWMSGLKITSQPKTAVVLKGGQVQFTVKAAGDGLAYQWQISDDSGKTWRNSAVKTATYTTTLTASNNGRRMRCVVSDKYGNQITSSAAVMWMSGLKITSQPQNAAGESGKTVQFTVKANGDGLTYQWQISDDSGKTWRASAVKSATYTTTLSASNNGRSMRCVVTDKYGNQVTSQAAVMTIAK